MNNMKQLWRRIPKPKETRASSLGSQNHVDRPECAKKLTMLLGKLDFFG